MYGSGATGIIDSVMVLTLTLLFPLLLLALPLLMERVERPLRGSPTTDPHAGVQPDAALEDVQQLAGQGYAPAVERIRRRRRVSSLLPERSGLRG